MSKRKRVKGSVALAVLLALASIVTANAGDYPNRPVKVIVPYPAGGTTDVVARIIAAELQKNLEQPFVIDNRGGASGVIAQVAVASSPNDGYTLLFSASGPLAAVPSTRKSLPYDPINAFTPINLVASAPLVLVSGPTVKVKTVADLIADAGTRSSSDTFTYGSWGNGSTSHLTGEMFADQAHIALLHVPYKGSAPVMNDLIAGHIDLTFDVIIAVAPQI